VVASGAFVSWYNAHPDAIDPGLSNVRSVVVIGNGNVAIDVSRILAKDATELAASDLPLEVARSLSSQPLKKIHVVGRRGPQEAKFSQHELAELGSLRRARPRVANPAELVGNTETVQTLRSFQETGHSQAQIAIEFHFGMVPTRFVGSDRLQAVQFVDREGISCELPAQLAVTCIGYESRACCSAQPSNGTFANENGLIRERLYVTGWARRGPTGTIPTNRGEAQQVAQRMAKEVTDAGRPGRAALRERLHKKSISSVDHAGWKRIDAAEIARAKDGQPRSKLPSVKEMLAVARG
jgi:ferredoxin--NADP+ reductase